MDCFKKLLLAGVAAPLALTAYSAVQAAPVASGVGVTDHLILVQAAPEDEENELSTEEDGDEEAEAGSDEEDDPDSEDAEDADEESESDADSEAELEGDAEGEAELEDEAEAEAEFESEAEADVEDAPEADLESESELGAEADPDVDPQLEQLFGGEDAEPQETPSEPDPGASVDTDAEADADGEPGIEAQEPESTGDRDGLRERLRERRQQERVEEADETEDTTLEPTDDVEAELEAEADAELDDEAVAPQMDDAPAEEAGEREQAVEEPEEDGGIVEGLRNLLSGDDEPDESTPSSEEQADTPEEAVERLEDSESEPRAGEEPSLRDRLRQRRQQERQAEDAVEDADDAPTVRSDREGDAERTGRRERDDDERSEERDDGPRERTEERDGDRDARPRSSERAEDSDEDRRGIFRGRERSADERQERRQEFQERVRERRGRGDRREARDDLDAIGDVREELRDEVRELRRQREEQLERLRDETRQGGGRVIERSGDRLIIRNENNNFYIQHNDTNRFVRGAQDVEVRELRGGYTETVVRRPGGVTIVTVRDRSGEIVTRTRVTRDGREIVLIDNRPRRDDRGRRGFRVDYYSEVLPPLRIEIPREQYIVETRQASPSQIRQALTAPPVVEVEQSYALGEVLHNERLRDMVPRVDLDTITFEFDSAEVPDNEIQTLEEIGYALEEILAENPDEIYLVEGHTDAPGSNTYNLALSDRRAENVAVILSEFFEIPPENLVTQGYGEEYLKIPTEARERENRRVTIRRITPLLAQQSQ